jgi:hypothetical protein
MHGEVAAHDAPDRHRRRVAIEPNWAPSGLAKHA